MGEVIRVPVYDKTDPLLTATIDEDDAIRVFRHDWQAWRPKGQNGLIYAVSRTHIGGGSYATTKMSELIMGRQPKGVVIDHKNGNGLDNQRSNLRIVTSTENGRNRKAKQNQKSSVFKGVTFHKKSGKWVSQICNHSVITRIGQFDTEEEAARAYDAVARETRGDMATFNFPRSRERSAITGIIEP